MVESKFYKPSKQSHKKLPKKVQAYILKILVTIIITLLILIGFKYSNDFKQLFSKYVYNTSFPFSTVKEFYQNYFKEPFVKEEVLNEKAVFEEKLTYSNKSLYQDGVKLTVAKEYMVPSLESGIVVFIGNKDSYNQTIIVQQMNGVDAWYGNIGSVNVELYDYVEKGSLLGMVLDNTLYMAFQKEGNFVDYKDYIS